MDNADRCRTAEILAKYDPVTAFIAVVNVMVLLSPDAWSIQSHHEPSTPGWMP